MLKRIILYGFLIALAAGVYFYRPYFEGLYLLSKEKIEGLGPNPAASLVETAKKEIAAPPPLRAEKESPSAFLTQKGVIEFTNEEREKNGKKILKENAELNEAAEKKAQDILAKQYFDHVSPDGKGPDYFVSSTGYDYITIGENLALGNFADDRVLVDAWMASPGHRENILQTGFREIGVAVIKGTYEGKSAWVAVQEFGTAQSECAAVDSSLKKKIESNQNKIGSLESELKSDKVILKRISPRDAEYAELAEKYNEVVAEYNLLLEKTKELIAKYNKQVEQYNKCINSF